MKESIQAARKNIARAVNTIQKMKIFLAAAQEVCEHKWEEAHDLFHYNGDSYYRCEICGKVR